VTGQPTAGPGGAARRPRLADVASGAGVSTGTVSLVLRGEPGPSAKTRRRVLEPPAVRLLTDGQQWIDFFAAVYDLYRRRGVAPALGRFRGEAFAESDRLAMARATDLNTNEQALANATYWFEHELRQYPAVHLDLDALSGHAGRIVLAAGRESGGHPCHDATMELGTRLGRRVTELPGGHVGFMTHAAAFATELLQTLPGPADIGRRPAG